MLKMLLYLILTGRNRDMVLTGQDALILQDSMSAHLDTTVATTLSEGGIKTFEFPPHSSHLTQILDGTPFSTWKAYLKKPFKTSEVLTNRTLEIVKAVRAFESASGYIHYRSAFRFVDLFSS